MRRLRDGQVWRLPQAGRAFVLRFSFVILLTAAFTLMVLGRAEMAAVERLRTAVTDLVAPLLDALSRPVQTVNDVVGEVTGFLALRDENARLLDANARLRRWEMVARRMETENAALRGLLNFKSEPLGAFVSARVVGDSGNAFVRTMLVNAGASAGISKNQAVITGDGLVGRVVELGQRSARILLLTDLNSRIPVVIQSTRQRAILAGDNSSTPVLTLLPENVRVEVGARVVTSGHGGLLPAGLPVGMVTGLDESGYRVRLFADLGRLEYVRVVNWSLPGFSPLAPTAWQPVAEPDAATGPVAGGAAPSEAETP